MKKGLTEMVFILDRSGSMGGLEKDTIGGYNSLIEKQKKEEGEALVSTVLFDHEQEVLLDRVPLDKIKEMTEDEYYVRGCTALLDAIGGAIHHIGNIHKYAREEDVPEKTIFVITTDGLENASKRYSYRDIKKMIKRQEEKYGWEFLFLGANIDVAKESDRLGIRQDRAVRYVNDSEGIELNYEVVGCAMSAMRVMPDSRKMDGSWKEKIEKDFKKRGRR
ncbi:MAG: VWA domain-containing protein [Firmicutes bacterium]|nr:VWA domain-containing protein [Bacillota bacterium]MBQ6608669.1 VWA domain-containing protein [Bacillota bacterium]